MVARAEQALYDHIQPRRCTRGQDGMRGVRVVEKVAEPLTQAERRLPCFLCGGVGRAVNSRADLFDVICHGRGHAWRLGIGGGGVVEIHPALTSAG